MRLERHPCRDLLRDDVTIVKKLSILYFEPPDSF